MESCFDHLIQFERVEEVVCQKCSEQACSLKKIKTNNKRLFLRQTTISKVSRYYNIIIKIKNCEKLFYFLKMYFQHCKIETVIVFNSFFKAGFHSGLA